MWQEYVVRKTGETILTVVFQTFGAGMGVGATDAANAAFSYTLNVCPTCGYRYGRWLY